jgi:drug/metabolite transporter (DMT)-like permease
MVTSVPFWLVLLDWIRPGGSRPKVATVFGLVAGATGIVLLVDPGAELGAAAVPPLETLVLLIGTLGWASGSLYSRLHKVGGSTTLLASLQMFVGGGMFLVIAAFRGELAGLRISEVSLRSWIAVGYLVLFGSIAALSAYLWLTRATTPARVGTYAFVNPVVALLLGAALAGERLTPRVGVATFLVLTAVALMTATRTAPIGARPRAEFVRRFRRRLGMGRRDVDPGA